MSRRLSPVLLALLAALILAPAAGAATFTVTDGADAVDANIGDGTCAAAAPGGCTLRAAVQEAMASAQADTIELPAGAVLPLGHGSAGDSDPGSGDLDVSAAGGPLTVAGAAYPTDPATISGTNVDRLFDVLAGGDLTLTGLRLGSNTITSSVDETQGGALIRAVDAGLTVRRARLSNGTAGGDFGAGGAILAIGTPLTVEDTEFENNAAPGNSAGGGALYVYSNAAQVVDVRRSLFRANSAYNAGGAIRSNGVTLRIENSTFTENVNSNNGGSAIIQVGAGASTRLWYSTVVANPGNIDSGFRVLDNGPFHLRGNILGSSNAVRPLCATNDSYVSDGGNLYNVAADASATNCNLVAAGDTNLSPALAPLGDVGGLVRAMAPADGSTAIDAGGATCPVADDVRGGARPQGTACDAGAVEPGSLTDPAMTAAPVGSVVAGNATPAGFTLANHGPDVAGEVRVALTTTAGAAISSASASAGTCAQVAGAWSCTVPNLAKDATATITAQVAGTAAGPASVTATATVTPQADAHAADSAATADFTVLATPVLPVTPVPPAAPAGLGAPTASGTLPAALRLSAVSLAKPSVVAGAAFTVRFTLSREATVTVTVSKLRRVCPKAAGAKACRTVARRIGARTTKARSGAGSLSVARLAGRPLPAGRYRVVVQAVSGAERASRTLALAVVARR